MKIAQVSPLYESVPPRLYGGTERIVHYLTEELVKKSHDVTLFASGDSETSARLIPVTKKALRLDPQCVDPYTLHFLLMEEVLKRQDEFDIIHTHIDCFGFVLARRTRVPVVSTLHGRLDLWEYKRVFEEYSEVPFISISDAQRGPLNGVRWVATVYHGLPQNLYSLSMDTKDYLVYVGRISPEKRVESAVRIALMSEVPLKIAAKVDKADMEYFNSVIRPLLKNSLIEFVGEVNDREKQELIGSAIAMLYPIDWPEPFGIVMIEAMACGTPVIARRRGSVPEVVDHGITGFIFEKDEEAVLYIKNMLSGFSREACREQFERRFLSERMAGEYLNAYMKVIAGEEDRRKSA
jgi:glycosyltransferase involved in cell wall biosynthesis